VATEKKEPSILRVLVFGQYEDCHLTLGDPLMFDGDVTLTGQADTWTLLPSLRSPLCGSVPVLKVGVHGDLF